MMALVLVIGLFAGCSKEDIKTETKTDAGTTQNAETSAQEDGTDSSTTTQDGEQVKEYGDIELWTTNIGYLPIEKDSKLYQLYKEVTGVGVIEPYVEWDGGTNYLNQLNMRIAAGEMPDVFTPFGGNEIDLAKNGAIVDLTELLPEYAPHVWNNIPQDVWDFVKASDPTGEGKIYWIPQVVTYARTAGMIRQDWLDKLGLEVPKTQEEFVEVLRAFKTEDPNGNGQADELPSGGRAEARWMDHLFLMYGVALDEGFPDWDIYNGELTYSAVTQNMRDALEFCAMLYKEGLIDTESLLNDKTTWDSKIYADKVGVYYHWSEHVRLYLENALANANVKQQWTVLPAIEVPGYEGQSFYPQKTYKSAQWVLANNGDEEKLMASLQLLNELYNPDNLETLYYGAEGMHYNVVDGQKVLLPNDQAIQENKLEPWTANASAESTIQVLELGMNAENEWSYSQAIQNVKDTQAYAKNVAGTGIPSSIYGEYEDIRNRTLYKEYASMIIIGEYPIEKFDEFVELWYEQGGEEVTANARAWYDSLEK